MRRLLLLFVTVAVLARSDLPALVWTADPTTYVAFGSGNANATSSGMQVSGFCFETDTRCGVQASFFRYFTVTSPGTFVISGSIENEVNSDNCIPIACEPSASVTSSFNVTSGFLAIPYPVVGLDL